MSWGKVLRKNSLVTRTMAVVVAMAMAFTMCFATPIISYAEDDVVDSYVTSFDSLDEEVSVQYVEVGATEDSIIFPDALTATLESQKEVTVETITEKIEEEEELLNEDDEEDETEEINEDVQPEDVTVEDEDIDGTDMDEAEEDDTSASAEETTPETVEQPAAEPTESEPVSESVAEPEPEPTSEPVDPVAFILDIVFPAMTVNAAEAEPEIIDVEEPVESAEEIEEVVEQPSVTYTTEIISTETKINISNVTWTIDSNRSSSAEFDSSVEGATFVYVANYESEYVVNAAAPTITVIIGEKEVDVAFEQSVTVDGVIISVKAEVGVFPEGSKLTARAATAEERDIFNNAVEEIEGEELTVELYVFDVSILDENNNEIQPDNSKGQVYITMTLETPAENEILSDMYHIPDSENGGVVAEKLAEEDGISLEAEIESFSLVGSRPASTEYVIDNDGYPYLVDQSGGYWGEDPNYVTLAVKVLDEATNVSYQWQKKSSGDWANIQGATAISYKDEAPAGNTYYRCLVNGNASKEIKILKSGDDGRTWTNSYKNGWYVTNGTMAYTVSKEDKKFDVVGNFYKNSTYYMLQTSYNAQGWEMKSSTNANQGTDADKSPNVEYENLYVRFSDTDAYAVIFNVDLKDNQRAFSFGTDTELGNDTTSGEYSDEAALGANLNTDNTLKSVVMIGHSTLDNPPEDAPAFVISPVTRTGLKYWLGLWNSRKHYANGGCDKYEGEDSGMTMSWVGLGVNQNVEFMFSVGDVASTGATGGNVNYSQERIEGLEPNELYTVNDGTTTYTIKATLEGYIPLVGAGLVGEEQVRETYDFTGKNVTIEKADNTTTPTTVNIKARPEAVEINSQGTLDGGNALRPVDIGTDTIVTSTNSVTINVSEPGQEYLIFDALGNEMEGYTEWVKPGNDGTITFGGLASGAEYTIKTRTFATSQNPSSLPTTGIKVTTMGTVTVQVPNSTTTDFDGTPKSYAVTTTPSDATVTYSTNSVNSYTDEVPSFTNAGEYTVYYKAVKEGCRTSYGSYTVNIRKQPALNGVVYSDKPLVISAFAEGTQQASLSAQMEGLRFGDRVSVVNNGYDRPYSNELAGVFRDVTTYNNNLVYSVRDSQIGTSGEIYLVVSNDNYADYILVVPVVTAYEYTLTKPENGQESVFYDGAPHSFPITTEDETLTVVYSTSEDGEYTEEVPTYSAPGEYPVYYKVLKNGHVIEESSYVVRIINNIIIQPATNNNENKDYPVEKKEIEKVVEETEEIVEETQPTIVEEILAVSNQPTMVEEEITVIDMINTVDNLGKGNIIDKGDIWGDMSDDTKQKLIDKLDETGGEIVKVDDLETVEEKIPVNEKPIALVIGEGSVIVTMELTDNTRTNAGLADASAVAQSILTPEQLAMVEAGSILEIKVEVSPLDTDRVTSFDKQIIEEGFQKSLEELPDLAMADYMDISMFMKIDDSDWGRITDTEPVDIVLEIPDQYKGLSDDYYIMRAHLGQSTLLKDIDEDADTITISTGQFSTYALMYNDAPVVATNVDLTSSAKCTFCHMCPTFLGICYFVWLFIFAVIVTMYTTYRTQKRHEKNND